MSCYIIVLPPLSRSTLSRTDFLFLQCHLSFYTDEIVCHPFFLSANGRHVSEDIPEIVNNAIESMKIDIPIITTEPVGSQTDVMIRAIHTSVRANSQLNGP